YDGGHECPQLYATYAGFINAHPPAMHFAGTGGPSGHNDFLLLQNPHEYATNALITASDAAGNYMTNVIPGAAHSRYTAYVPLLGVGPYDQGVTVTTSNPTLPLWAEHADYWNNNEAARASEGVYEQSDTWYFAEGSSSPGGGFWNETNTVYNPSTTSSVTVTWH